MKSLFGFSGKIALVALLLSPTLLYADIFDDLALAFKSGNAKEIAKYFNSNVELTTPTSDDVYSKAQAEMLLKDFFAKYQPRNFVISHRGSSTEGSRFAIAYYECAQGKFRVNIYIRESAGKALIQELRFEKE